MNGEAIATEFDEYVKSGYYSRWYEDSIKSYGSLVTKIRCRAIREYRMAQYSELDSAMLLSDSSTIFDESFENQMEVLFTKDHTIKDYNKIRLMVGNHGVYLETPLPANWMTGEFIEASPKDGSYSGLQFIKNRLQYVEYRNEFDEKFYHQIKGVNYADYKPGFWYVAYDVLIDTNRRRSL